MLDVAPLFIKGELMKRKWKNFQEQVAPFFEEVQRTGSDIHHNILVVKTEKYHEFIDFIVSTPKISDKYKLMIILQLSTGSRISEVLHMKKKDFTTVDDNTLVNIRVLKKRLTKTKKGTTCLVTPRERISAIHPKILPLLNEWLFSLKDEDYLFANQSTGKPYSREGVWEQYREMMGSTTHGFRHSRINYMLEEQDCSVVDIANHMQFSTVEVAYRYSNTNQKKAALKLAEKEKRKAA